MTLLPKGLKLRKDENVLEIEWQDGSSHRHPAWDLRCDCRCAGCVDEITGERLLDFRTVPAEIRIVDAKMVGNYSIKLVFSDGHDTGLFTWEHLKQLGERP
jgi:DUF971 family protein